MEKEQAIETLRANYPDACYEQLREAVDAAIEALKAQDAAGDKISRQAAIDRFNVIRPVDPKKDEYTKGIDVGIAMCIVAVKDQPCAQPEPPWILCSKKMPDEHEWLGTKEFGTTISDEVYVTFENEKGERFCKHMKFQNGELSRYDKAYMEAWYKGSKTIAWMPLPLVYTGDEK